MNFKLIYSVSIAFVLFFASCKNEREPLLPNITGKAGEVVVVVGGTLWEGQTGQIFKETLSADTEVLPQAEPMFNLVQIPWPSFTNIFKTHRNLVLVSLNTSEPKAKMVVRRNVWAKPQTVIEIIAPNEADLAGFTATQAERISNHFLVAERNRIIDNYRRYEKREIGERLWKNHDLSVVVPAGFTMDVETDNFIWIANETPQTSQGVLIYYYDYQSKETFTQDYLLNKRNEVLRRNVPGSVPRSYMTTDMLAPGLFNEFMRNGRYFAELRGLWKVENDFMGGPFVSLTTLDESRNRVITVEGFVYAPNTEKRNLLRQVEAILYTLEIRE